MIHPALERWFGIPIPQEYQARRNPEELACLTPEFKLRPLHELYAEIGDRRVAAAREELRQLPREEQQRRLRGQWGSLLGGIEPNTISLQSRLSERIIVNAGSSILNGLALPHPKSQMANPKTSESSSRRLLQLEAERIVLETDGGTVLPILLLLPHGKDTNPPVVIGLSQQGKSRFLTERAGAIAELLAEGVAVCLPDVRGTGETSPPGSRHYRSEATAISATEWMLGRTLLGARLQDLRSILRYLRTRPDLDARQLALWGDSFAPTNPRGFSDPLMDEGEQPQQSEPLGGLLALLGALYENDVRAIAASGTLAGYQAVLRDRFCYVPHDAIVPGALTAGDLPDLAAGLVPRPLRLSRLVDGRNVLMTSKEVQPLFASPIEAYRSAPDKLLLLPSAETGLATWIVSALSHKAP
jgi:hypothetical protein